MYRLYCYRMPDDSVREELYAKGEAPAKVRFEDGQTGVRDEAAEIQGWGNKGHTPGNWPKQCSASGVMSSQAKEAYEDSVRRGVPTQFAKNGDAVYTSAAHRKKYCEAIGMFDRNGGYGDPSPKVLTR